MSQTLCVIVSPEDAARLEAVVADRNRPLKHAQRARIVLASSERLTVLDVARRTGASRPAVWRWQARYAAEGVEGLLRDKTRPPGKAPLAAAVIAKILALTCAEPPGEAIHWTGRAMAKAMGVSLSTIQRIWAANRLQPHRFRTFKRSRDPAFAAKVEDVVGLYMHPPAHALVLSIDEKSQIQALDRTQPGLPLKPGKCGTMTHDYKRHGTTTLFAALNVLDGVVIGRCMQHHRHQEFIASPTPSSAKFPSERTSMPSWTTTAPTKTPRSKPGSIVTRDGRFTSRQPQPPGSMPLKASSQSSQGGDCGAASSPASSIFRLPSTATSGNTTQTPSPSSGSRPPLKSSTSSPDWLHPPSDPVH